MKMNPAMTAGARSPEKQHGKNRNPHCRPGAAGISAAIYTARAGFNSLVLGMEPKVAGDYLIDNYFGFPEAITGKELIERGMRQAKKFGVTMVHERALSIHYEVDAGISVTTDKREIDSCAVILATGIERKKPEIRNVSEYEGRGVSYCVSCDGYFFKDKQIMVVGEGNYAANQALELLAYSHSVRICTMGEKPAMNPDFMKKLNAASIPVMEQKISALKGGKTLSHIILDSGADIPVDGIFVAWVMRHQTTLQGASASSLTAISSRWTTSRKPTCREYSPPGIAPGTFCR